MAGWGLGRSFRQGGGVNERRVSGLGYGSCFTCLQARTITKSKGASMSLLRFYALILAFALFMSAVHQVLA